MSKKKLPEVLILPDWRNGNPYQDLLAKAISQQGYHVVFDQFRQIPFALQKLRRTHPTALIFHIHWINNLIAPLFWSNSFFKRSINLSLLVVDILWLRVHGIKVIWTIHNLVAHESPDPRFEVQIRRIITKTVDRIILHSKSALDCTENMYGCKFASKTTVIPHGNYIGIYQPSKDRSAQIRNKLGIRDSNLVYLFFGSIRRYKGVTELVKAFFLTTRKDLRLLIYGSCNNPDLREEIRSSAQDDSRIILKLDFTPEEDVAPLFDVADAVILPFARTLTSGSTVLAMSLGKALILPEDARVFDIGIVKK